MRRMFIIGATVLALSVTAVVAWAGTGPSATVPGQVTGVVQNQDIDPVVSRFMERVHNVWTWPGDAVEYLRHTNLDNEADWGRGIDYDWDMDRTHDVTRDRDMNQDYDQNYDQDMDRTHDVTRDRDMNQDYDWDMDRTHDVTRDRDMNQDYDQNYDYDYDRGSDRTHDVTRDRDMNQGYDQNYDQNMGGSSPMGIDRDCDRRGGWNH